MSYRPQIIRKWRHRINRRNKNLLIMVCGQTGSGKSYSALTIAKLINSNFDVNKHVVFNVEDFMELLNNGKLKRGSVVVWDEAGVGIPAREWYTISNKAINYVLQTFRHLNLCVIFTTPSFDYIDKQTRLLFHVYIETVRIDFENKKAVVKVFENSFSPRFGKAYQSYIWNNGEKMERINISKPTKKMIKAYEELKKVFSKSLREGVAEDLSTVKKKELRKKLTDDDWIEKIKAAGIDIKNLYKVCAYVQCAPPRGKRIQARYNLQNKNVDL